MRVLKILCVPVLMLFCAAAYAQDLQIPLDAGGRIPVLTSEGEMTLRLFPEVNGFVEARLYRTGEGLYSLEVVYRQDGSLMRRRTVLDEAGLRGFRARLAERSDAARFKPAVDQEGRYTLLAASTAYSLILYGPMSAQILGISSGSDIAAIECLAGAAGFFVPFWRTSDADISKSEAYAYAWGSGFGALHGALLGLLIYGGNSIPDRALPSLVLAGSLIEGFGGYALADRLKLPEGRVALTASGALWGTVWAMEGMAALSQAKSARGTSAVLLAGSFGTAALGYALSGEERYTSGDVLVNNLSAVLGGYIPLAFGKAAGVSGPRTYAGLSLAGSMAGTAAGYFLVKGRDFGSGDAGLISLGMFSGALAGFSASYYFAPDSLTMALTLSSIGASAGFAAIYMLFRDSAHSAADGPFRIDITPQMPSPSAADRPLRRRSAGYEGIIPCISAVYSF